MTPTQQSRGEHRYERVLRVVEYNTGGPNEPQRAGVRRCEVHLILVAHGPYDLDRVEYSIGKALTDGDLFVFEDEAGRERLARRTPEGLRAVVGEQNAREEPDVDLQERCVEALQEVDGS